MAKKTIYTIGHSTLKLSEFIKILKAYGIKELVDVRTIPMSRHNPQFNEARFSRALRKAGIRYLHDEKLGGLRHASKDSINLAWRNASFRGFADYMQTREFASGIRELVGLSKKRQIAIMCAEAVPWRCHRSLIADALFARKIPVEHIFSATNHKKHTMTPWAKVRGTKITYPKARN